MLNHLFFVFLEFDFAFFKKAKIGMKYGIFCVGMVLLLENAFVSSQNPVYPLEAVARAEDEFSLDVPVDEDMPGDDDTFGDDGEFVDEEASNDEDVFNDEDAPDDVDAFVDEGKTGTKERIVKREKKSSENEKNDFGIEGQKENLVNPTLNSPVEKNPVKFSRGEMRDFPPVDNRKREKEFEDDFFLESDSDFQSRSDFRGGDSSAGATEKKKNREGISPEKRSSAVERGSENDFPLLDENGSESRNGDGNEDIEDEFFLKDPEATEVAEVELEETGSSDSNSETDSKIDSEVESGTGEAESTDFEFGGDEDSGSQGKNSPQGAFRQERVPGFSTEELALRERIRKTLRVYSQISLCSEENRPIDVISYVIPYGCDAEIFFGCREANVRINAIGALCWNVPMGDESAFTNRRDKLMPRLGYGIQQYSGQLLAALALARVSIDYRFPAGWAVLEEESSAEALDIEKKVSKTEKSLNDAAFRKPRGKKRFGVRNLVEFEQKNCHWGRDLSMTLVGLSYYLSEEDVWENMDGEKWTLERLVENELKRPMSKGDSASTNQLLGLFCAIRCQQMRTKNAPLTGAFARADDYLKQFQKYVLELQNEIGIWHPEFFLKKGATPNQPTEMLISSGHILRWLASVTSREELANPQIFKAVSVVNELLEYQLAYWDPANASGTEIEGVMAALHALKIYEKRRFKQIPQNKK